MVRRPRPGTVLALTLVSLLVIAASSLHRRDRVPSPPVVQAGTPGPSRDRSCPGAALLARRYAPALALAPDDEAPRTVELLLDQAKVEYRSGDSAAVETGVDGARLGELADHPEAFIELPPSLDDAAAHRRLYEQAVATDHSGRYAVTAYASVHCDTNTADLRGHTVIQYWLFYLYNDFYNKHDGDWELIQVVLDTDGQPQFAAYAQHNSYTWRDWSEMLVERRLGGDGVEEQHPRVYVAKGSHASYFQYAPSGYGGDTVVDAQNFIVPRVQVLPPNPDAAPAAFGWLRFPGHWGKPPTQPSCKGCQMGPVGPVYNAHGAKWHTPLGWGGRTLTRDDLIAHQTCRITVRSSGRVQFYDAQNRHTGPLPDGRFERAAPGVAHLTVPGSQQHLVLVPGLTPTTRAVVEVEGADIASLDVLIPDGTRALHIRFPAVQMGPAGRARLELGSSAPVLEVDADGDGRVEQTVAPSILEQIPMSPEGG